MIRRGLNFFINNSEVIVVVGATAESSCMANTKSDAFYSRYSVHNLGNSAFYSAEHGFADTGRQSYNSTFNLAANAVATYSGRSNSITHLLTTNRIDNGEVCCNFFQLRIERVKVIIIDTMMQFNVVYPFNVRSDANSHLLQPLLAQPACDAERCGEPTGEMSAAGGVLEAAILNLGGVVRMTGPGAVF